MPRPYFGGSVGIEPYELRGTSDAQLARIGLGPWTTYTPELTAASSDPTLGTDSVQAGYYTRIGRTITGRAIIAFGTSGTAAGSGLYRISLPVPSIDHTLKSRVVGTGLLFDISGSALRVPMLWVPDGVSTYAQMHTVNDGLSVTHAAPWAWAASDTLEFQFTYEAAS